MRSSPLVLDIYCGGGGAGMGYKLAGFEVVGVDNVDQPDYPFEVIRKNALDLTYDELLRYDLIHASPPCQGYSKSTAVARRNGKKYPDLYHQTKAMLIASGKPYVIENVMGSPARGIGLCGTMFGLGVFRHRIFESNVPLVLPEKRCSCSKKRIDGVNYVTVAGNQCTKAQGLPAMGITWNMSKLQMNEAIPPVFTQFIGQQIMTAWFSEIMSSSFSYYEHRFLQVI